MLKHKRFNIKDYKNRMDLLHDERKTPAITKRVHSHTNLYKRRMYKDFKPFKKESKYIYAPSYNLPKDGWIQNCIFCHSSTTITHKINDYSVYCCNRCNKKYDYYQKYHKMILIKNAYFSFTH